MANETEAPTTEQPTTATDATAPAPAPSPPPTTWRARGRARRRLRYLRAARELALRDLGGLVFELHRQERERPDLVTAKLDALAELDRERRTLEDALDDRRDVDVLRLPGLASCPRCGTLLASDARFCSSCGHAVSEATPPAAGDDDPS